ITTFAGGGGWVYSGENMPATNASLNFPYGAAFDAYGNLFIADTGDHRIRKVGFTGYPTLILNNVTTNNAGDYTVVVTGSGTRVTSRDATLTLMTAPTTVLITAP